MGDQKAGMALNVEVLASASKYFSEQHVEARNQMALGRFACVRER